MHRLLRSSFTAALLCLSLGFDAARAGPDGDCGQKALEHLRASSPGGFAIYKQVSDPRFFESWLRCDDAQFDLSTAVHESTHFIAAETDAFPLVGGGAIARPHEVSKFFPPSQIAKRFKADDFTTIYLRLGKASSSTDFLYLLDELNAYSHDLDAAVDLKALKTEDEAVDHRDGLAAMMAFVAVYAETAKESEAATSQARASQSRDWQTRAWQSRTWRGLREPQIAGTISEIWGRAERVMASSCGIPNFGSADKTYIRYYCTARAQSALEPILGRPPICPTACLSPALDVAQENGVAGPDGRLPHPSESRSAAGPSWIRNVIRFQDRDAPAPAMDETR